MEIESPAEAFATLAVLVLGADRVGTFEERRFLFEQLADHPVFEGMEPATFAEFITDVTARVCDSFPTEDMRVTLDGVSQAVDRLAPRLTPELRTQAYRLATDLARVDGLEPTEEEVLERIRRGLGVEEEDDDAGDAR